MKEKRDAKFSKVLQSGVKKYAVFRRRLGFVRRKLWRMNYLLEVSSFVESDDVHSESRLYAPRCKCLSTINEFPVGRAWRINSTVSIPDHVLSKYSPRLCKAFNVWSCREGITRVLMKQWSDCTRFKSAFQWPWIEMGSHQRSIFGLVLMFLFSRR